MGRPEYRYTDALTFEEFDDELSRITAPLKERPLTEALCQFAIFGLEDLVRKNPNRAKYAGGEVRTYTREDLLSLGILDPSDCPFDS
jgi:hypothetical protein